MSVVSWRSLGQKPQLCLNSTCSVFRPRSRPVRYGWNYSPY